MIRLITLIVLAATLTACGNPSTQTPPWLTGRWEGKYAETKGMYAGQDCAVQIELKPDRTFQAELSAQMMGATTRIKYAGKWELAEGSNKGPLLNLIGKISEQTITRGTDTKPQKFSAGEIVWPLQVLNATKQLKPEIWTFPEDAGVTSITINPLLYIHKVEQ